MKNGVKKNNGKVTRLAIAIAAILIPTFYVVQGILISVDRLCAYSDPNTNVTKLVCLGSRLELRKAAVRPLGYDHE